MSAKLLREAAELMRERAEDASAAPWWRDGLTVRGGPEGRAIAPAHNAITENATHIASWHPAVALAVADLLEDAAESLDLHTPTGEAAVAVALTYLGLVA